MNQRVLIIDDEEHIRLLLQETLSDIYDVTLHNSGFNAIDDVKKSIQDDEPFSVVITDLNMPNITGPEVASEILKIDDRIMIILMTAESRNISEYLEPSVKDNLILIRKPFSLDEILMVTQYLNRSWLLARKLEKQSLELQRKIKQSEKIRAGMEAIWSAALDCIITIDQRSRVTEWNPAAEQTFGWTSEEILGKTLTETLIPSEYAEAHYAGVDNHLKHGGGPILGKRIEIVARNKAGNIFPVELAVVEIENKDEPGFTAYLRDISAQKEAEEQMRLQSKTLEAAANGIIITDTDGNIVWANPAFFALTGYDINEVVGNHTRILKSGEHPVSFYQDIWSKINSGEVWQGEIINKRKDGSLYTEEMTITPVLGVDNEIINYIAIKQDVTERKRVNEQLVRNEKSQRIINYFATSLAGSNTVDEILWDIVSNCISEMDLVDAVVYLVGDSGSELIQRAAFGEKKAKNKQVIDPIVIPLGQGIVGNAASKKQSLLIHDVQSDPRYIIDDEVRGSELAVPIIYENQVIGVIDSEHPDKSYFQEYHQQIFEAIASLAANKIMRIISQERTEKSEQKYRSIFESIQDVYAEVDLASAEILEISPSIEGLSGYSRDEMIGQPLSKFYAPPGAPPELWKTLTTEGHINDFEVTLMDKGGEPRTVSFTASLMMNEEDQSEKIVGTMRDISHRKKAEQALQDNVSIKTNFVSNVSHELRTPMASILGFAGTILRDKDMPDETKMDFVRIINDEAKRLTRLIENVLDISRMEAGTTSYKLVPTQLEDIIEEVLDSQQVLANKKGLKLVSSIEKNLPQILAAADSMNQMAVNLISNAIKFTEAPGTITVNLSLKSNHLVFEVSDTGLGIPKPDLPKILDKFYRVDRAKREDQGTGIGLSIVKEIIDAHASKLEIESEVGVGSTFCVSIPIMKN